MLALVMCLLVLGVACAVVLRDGLREEPDQRATKPSRARRARVQRARHPIRSHRRRPVRAGLLLVATTAGIGVATAAAVGLAAIALAVALRSVGGDAP